VRLLKNGVEKPGVYKVIWDGKDNQGNKVSSGIYFCRLSTNKFTATKKVVKTE
jgi:flagellar hook assembly protein FlgD